MKAWLAAAAAAVAAVGIVFAVLPGQSHDATSVHATVAPAAPLFGDLVTATVELRGRARGATVSASFAPFEVVRVQRSPGAWRFTLRCVAVACLTRGRTTQLHLPPARVGGTLVQWPPLTLGSRLTAADAAKPVFRANTSPPAPSYRVDPVVAGWALAGLAAALVLGVGAWGAVVLRRRPPVLQLLPDDRELTPLERALEALERSVRESVERRRVALDEVAGLLDDPGLAQRARRLGWSHARPGRDAILELLADCRREEAA